MTIDNNLLSQGSLQLEGISPIISRFKVSIRYICQTTTILFVALSAGIKHTSYENPRYLT